MRRLTATLLAMALLTAALAATAQADPSEYGIESLSATPSSTQAGAHPDLTVSFALKTEAGGQLPSTTREARFELPPGLLGNPNAVAKCTTEQLMSTDFEDPSNATGCPQDSQIGIAEATLFKEGNQTVVTEPFFNMQAPADGETVARFGFIGDVFPVVVDASLRSESDYGVEVTAVGISSFIPLLSAKTTVWGVPADKSHDSQRMTPYESLHTGGVPETPTGKRPSGLTPAPFLTNPTRCGVAQSLKLTVTSYAEPERHPSAETTMPTITGCGKLQFEPKLSLTPTSATAAEPTGLDTETTLRQDETVDGLATSTVRAVRVLFPRADGGRRRRRRPRRLLRGRGRPRHPRTAHCPEAAKIGMAEIEVPALEHPLHAALYQRQPTPATCSASGSWPTNRAFT